MRQHSPQELVDGSAARSAEPSTTTPPAPPQLSLIVCCGEAVAAPPQRDLSADRAFEQLQRHLLLARRLGISPLTVVERAESLLKVACDGWRDDGRCVNPSGEALADPHEACVLAQYHHDLLLLEHGLLNLTPDTAENTDRRQHST